MSIYSCICIEGGKVDVWNIKKGENICTIRYSTVQSKPVTCVKVSVLLKSI